MQYQNADSVTDQQLIDYILKVLPQDEEAIIAMYLHDNQSLRSRLSSWESVLFQLNDNIGEIKPPTAIWQHIEKRLSEMNQTPRTVRKPAMLRYLLPAFLTLCTLFGLSYYFAYQPTYKARIVTKDIPLWLIEGNTRSIKFTSLSDVSLDGKHSVAWLVKPNGTVQKLGVIPDWGKEVGRRIALPEVFSTQSGDKVVVVMVAADYRKKQIPQQRALRHETVLTER